jgi:hypothetical protein
MATRSHAENLKQKTAECDRQCNAMQLNTFKNISHLDTACVARIY